jgi:putative restriction endonuclease
VANQEEEIRAAAFAWLEDQTKLNGGAFERNDLINKFYYHGQNITLIGASGIWFPKGFTIPISITTTSTGPYDDGFTSEGLLEYRYRGTNPDHRDNIGLTKAFEQRTPLIYFHSIKPGKYVAVWPLFIVSNDPINLKIKAAINPALNYLQPEIQPVNSAAFNIRESDIGVRRYITAVTKQRLHQTAFREFVLDAYSRQCTMCKLQHVELLDAAHIIPDSEKDGVPIVQNGLSLCKIHHAAYDNNIIGITPDFTIKVRENVLSEIDGPMLKYGLQSMEGKTLILPARKTDYPDRDRLARRYELFVA